MELQSEGGGLDPASTCRVLHALIKQRQRDIERGKEAAERLARMGHDLRVRDQQREKMHGKLAAKERELGAIENKVGCPFCLPAHLLLLALTGTVVHLSTHSIMQATVPLYHSCDSKTDGHPA